MAAQLTPAQQAVLTHAIEHSNGKVHWFPDNIKGGARQKVLDSLCKRALLTTDGTGWFVTDEGCDALGVPRKTPVNVEAVDGAIEQARPRTRDNSKQAQVIAMLKRPEGATINQIRDITGWQAHTVRGTFAGAFRNKLGLTITSHKEQGGERVYRIA